MQEWQFELALPWYSKGFKEEDQNPHSLDSLVIFME